VTRLKTTLQRLAIGLVLAVPFPAAGQTANRNDALHFAVDPVADGTLIVGGFGFSILAELILSTGEIVPQRTGSPSNLLGIDRVAVTQQVDPHAARNSSVMLAAAISYAAIDPLVSIKRGGLGAAAVDAVIYAESLSLTWTIADLTKIAVRRPRPSAYRAQATNPMSSTGEPLPGQPDTNSELSFFSGHAAIVAATSATASYLAFTRAPGSLRAWSTLSAGALLTTAVSYERVRAGAHFPTDVIAGALAGACIGVLVPHLHRHHVGPQNIWIGVEPAPQGASVALTGRF
jgi:membrane-associated phospholipid phosphatase